MDLYTNPGSKWVSKVSLTMWNHLFKKLLTIFFSLVCEIAYYSKGPRLVNVITNKNKGKRFCDSASLNRQTTIKAEIKVYIFVLFKEDFCQSS